MTKKRRILRFLFGVISILTGLLIALFPELGYYMILLILSFGLAGTGIGTLIYYATMARYMIGGKLLLYQGVILLDLGVLAMSLYNVPRIYFFTYLVVLHLFYGVIDILRVRENRKLGSRSWKLVFTQGFFNLLIPVICIIFVGSPDIAVIIYGIGLIISGAGRLASAFRRTAFVYVQ